MANFNRWRIAASVTLIILVVLATGGFDCGGGGGPPPPAPTVGSITVTTGFGAVTSTPYACTGSGTITVTPGTLTGTAGTGTAQSKPFTYTGNSSTSDTPACTQTVSFGNLRPGSWTATNGGGSCAAPVTAGQFTTVKIYNNVCQP